ncbi:MAG: hypothetical protein U0441_37565 [Polyangiaceae bacterium]
MIVFSREVYACRCNTHVPEEDPGASEIARKASFRSGTVADLAALDPAHHDMAHLEELALRLRAGETWTVAELDGRIVHYFWISTARRCVYPSLPGCEFELCARTGYGHDAWTHPDLRSSGVRRRSFLYELNLLREMGRDYEASFFVAYQLEGATRSLAKVGIVVEPLWKIHLTKERSLRFEALRREMESMWPVATEGSPAHI